MDVGTNSSSSTMREFRLRESWGLRVSRGFGSHAYGDISSASDVNVSIQETQPKIQDKFSSRFTGTEYRNMYSTVCCQSG